MKSKKKIKQRISRIDKRIANYANYLCKRYSIVKYYKGKIAFLNEELRKSDNCLEEGLLGAKFSETCERFNQFKRNLKKAELEQRKLKNKRKKLNKELNKQFTEKDEEKMVTIPLSVFERLCRRSTYFVNWGDGAVNCKRCGSLNPEGYVCAVCDWDNSFEPSEEEKIKINYLGDE